MPELGRDVEDDGGFVRGHRHFILDVLGLGGLCVEITNKPLPGWVWYQERPNLCHQGRWGSEAGWGDRQGGGDVLGTPRRTAARQGELEGRKQQQENRSCVASKQGEGGGGTG